MMIYAVMSMILIGYYLLAFISVHTSLALVSSLCNLHCSVSISKSPKIETSMTSL